MWSKVRCTASLTAHGGRAAGGGQRAGGMRDCGFVEFSAGGRLQLRAGSVETDGRLRRRRIETELICWWSVESVKRCEAWEEMKEEKAIHRSTKAQPVPAPFSWSPVSVCRVPVCPS